MGIPCSTTNEKRIDKNWKKMKKKNWLQGESNPGLLARLAEALPLDQGVNWILQKKNSLKIDLSDYQIFIIILLT